MRRPTKPIFGPCRICGRMVLVVRWVARGRNGQNGVAPTYICRHDCKGVRDAD